MSKKKKEKIYPRNTDTVIKKEMITTLDRGVIAHTENGIVTLRDKNGVPYAQSGIEMTKMYIGERKTRVITKATELATDSNNVAEWLKTLMWCMLLTQTRNRFTTESVFFRLAPCIKVR